MKCAVLLPFSLVSACAGIVEAPSLAPRAAEAADIDRPAPAPTPPQAADAAQASFIAKMIDLARGGDVAFQRVLPASQTRAAPQTEAWIVAQNARSAAESARGPTLDALTNLDTEIGIAIDKGKDTAALVAARRKVQTIYNHQAAELDVLSH